MADKATQQIEDLIARIFQNRKERELAVLREEFEALKREGSRRGMIKSGWFLSSIGKMCGKCLIRIIEQLLEELEKTFRQAGRRDAEFFWKTVSARLQSDFGTWNVEFGNMAQGWLKPFVIDERSAPLVARSYSQVGDSGFMFFVNKIGELSAKTRFVVMKSPEDRKASGVPDVAVMMWFPPEGDLQARIKAEEKFKVISETVKKATGGLASVDRVDNPTAVHKDRITPVIEEWLTKAVLVICDLEQNRPNVFYEFGFARASGTDVIVTRPVGTPTDFHLAHWNIDEYKDWEELAGKIGPRIERILKDHDLSGTR